MKIALLFPNQLFEDYEILYEVDEVYLIEEYLFFKQYQFHKQKIMFHRASMQFYKTHLEAKNIKVNYIESISQ
jgi:deoxyribodipyrimidine photolyase-related protein